MRLIDLWSVPEPFILPFPVASHVQRHAAQNVATEAEGIGGAGRRAGRTGATRAGAGPPGSSSVVCVFFLITCIFFGVGGELILPYTYSLFFGILLCFLDIVYKSWFFSKKKTIWQYDTLLPSCEVVELVLVLLLVPRSSNDSPGPSAKPNKCKLYVNNVHLTKEIRYDYIRLH